MTREERDQRLKEIRVKHSKALVQGIMPPTSPEDGLFLAREVNRLEEEARSASEDLRDKIARLEKEIEEVKNHYHHLKKANDEMHNIERYLRGKLEVAEKENAECKPPTRREDKGEWALAEGEK